MIAGDYEEDVFSNEETTIIKMTNKIKITFVEAFEDGSVELEIDGHAVAGMIGKTYDIDFSTDPIVQKEDEDDNLLQEELGK